MSQELRFLCKCGCKAYVVPHFFPKDFVLKYMDESEKNRYNPDDEFYHQKGTEDVYICSGTQPNLNDLTFPKNHWTFDINQPCDFNAFEVRNKFNDLIMTPILLKGDCKCMNKGLPVNRKL